MSAKGTHLTEEQKDNIRQAKLGHQVSEDTRQKIRESLIGHTTSPETMEKLRQRRHTQETKDKIKLTSTGRTHTQEAKEKIRQANLGSQHAKGAIRSEETRDKIRVANRVPRPERRGVNSPSWKGGCSRTLRMAIQASFEYKEWRREVFTRDRYTCLECGQIGGYLHVHHITHFQIIMDMYSIETVEEARECDDLWDTNNGVALCKKCHRQHHIGKDKK